MRGCRWRLFEVVRLKSILILLSRRKPKISGSEKLRLTRRNTVIAQAESGGELRKLPIQWMSAEMESNIGG
jgi:hypothetical protein